MLKYQCKCGETKDLMRATLEVVEGKVRCKQAKCKCGEYMQEVEKDFNGMPNIIRNESYNKGDKLWDSAKEKLCGERGINEKFD
jgi:hypothetical protein